MAVRDNADAPVDFLALGLSATSLAALLWSVAMGRRAVGVGSVTDAAAAAGVWNVPVDVHHQLALMDALLLERYGEDRLPRDASGRRLRLAEALPGSCAVDPAAIRGDVGAVLRDPRALRVESAELVARLHGYAAAIEALDRARREPPRVRLVERRGARAPSLAGAELCVVDGPDAQRLGLRSVEVRVDRNDGRGPVAARSDFAVGWVRAPGAGELARRCVVTERDEDGDEYRSHRRLLGAPGSERAWAIVGVPTFMTFGPQPAAGLRAFFTERVRALVDADEVALPAPPRLVRVAERIGERARVAANAVVVGTSFGQGNPMNDGEVVSGLVGHAARVLAYWRARDEGSPAEPAVAALAAGVQRDTEDWIEVGAADRTEAPQAHFDADCFAEIERAERARGRLLANNGRAGAVDTIAPPEVDLLRWVAEHPAERRELVARWLHDTTPREQIAEQLGIPLGALLRRFNETAPLQAPIAFTYRGHPYSVVGMAGICDDVAGGRFPAFGEPVTLRAYLTDDTLLDQGMFEAADWNYMDAGLPGFVGYAYGVRHERTLYLAGVQSDLGVRYSYLFQGREGATDVRSGDDVVTRPASDLAARFGRCVPVLRRTFQRYWIAIMLGAVTAWAVNEPELDELGLLQFALEPEEDRKGHVVHRLYRELPHRLGWSTRHVRLADACHSYRVAPLDDVIDYLGDRWRLAEHGAISRPAQGRASP